MSTAIVIVSFGFSSLICLDCRWWRCPFNIFSFKYQKYYEISKEGRAKVIFQKIRRSFEEISWKCQKVSRSNYYWIITWVLLERTPQLWVSNVDFFVRVLCFQRTDMWSFKTWALCSWQKQSKATVIIVAKVTDIETRNFHSEYLEHPTLL